MNRFELTHTNDQSFTIRDNVFNETFHSLSGAISESMYVFIQNGLQLFHSSSHLNIFEMGFGTGLNALLTYLKKPKDQYIYYESIDLYPITHNFFKPLFSIFQNDEQTTYKKMLYAPWNESSQIDEMFLLKKIQADFLQYTFHQSFDLIYYDAFCPKTQPQLWSEEMMRKIYNALSPNGILVTYASSGIVKTNLRNTGFHVKRLPALPPKKHMIRAQKS
ncbi:MAG: tRNA (5-methylaminomethyl-2-thiouridine)(34)-methyltransferase MnmD [Bacteroidales bacterium]|nr:tRNA (5-methylaminomethyl-2-thiouridine)(34)-methyltransferase MnmD [Bacteroidales bacterium]